jgi:hypothetical protein
VVGNGKRSDDGDDKIGNPELLPVAKDRLYNGVVFVETVNMLKIESKRIAAALPLLLSEVLKSVEQFPGVSTQ